MKIDRWKLRLKISKSYDTVSDFVYMRHFSNILFFIISSALIPAASPSNQECKKVDALDLKKPLNKMR